MKKVLYPLFALCLSVLVFANDYRVVIHIGECLYAVPVDTIKSIALSDNHTASFCINNAQGLSFSDIDSITHDKLYGDTMYVIYKGTRVIIKNTRADVFCVRSESIETDIVIGINSYIGKPVISVSGESKNGRLCVNSDIDYSIILDGVNLSSSHAPALNSISKQKVSIILKEGTANEFSDANQYAFEDEEETSNGCINSQGAITITGNGQLTVNGKAKHAIYAKKSITMKNGVTIVQSAVSDALHSGKNVNIEGGELKLIDMQGDGIDLDDNFTMTGGCITMNITGEAAKGIKCGKLMNISNGTITAVGTGALKNKKGDLSYCTILKCDSCITISGGDFNLVNNSPGGKCISANHNLEISGGTFYLETNGDGAEYSNANGELDYYTSKCVVADSAFIKNGTIKCISTGLGGKGIVGEKWVVIGQKECAVSMPYVEIMTKGECIINDTIRDLRNGCPKGIKAGERFYMYNGNVYITTNGMGGEGIESKGSFFCYGGSIICDTFDDGINVENKLHIFNGYIYCNSLNNDGIDSNGRFTIEDGIVVSISQHIWDESLDSDIGIDILGGIVLGIGNDKVNISQNSKLLYNTVGTLNQLNGTMDTEWNVTAGKYIHICDEHSVLMSVECPLTKSNVYFTICHNDLDFGKNYSIIESEEIIRPQMYYFDHRFSVGGTIPLLSNEIGKFQLTNN